VGKNEWYSVGVTLGVFVVVGKRVWYSVGSKVGKSELLIEGN